MMINGMQKSSKSIMLIVIFTVSITIFIFAYSAVTYNHYYPQRQCEVMSENTAEYVLSEGQHKISDIRKALEGTNARYCIAAGTSGTKAIEFNKENIGKLKISGDVDEYNSDDDVALLSKDHLQMMTAVGDRKYIVSGGVRYKVIGLYEDTTDDALKKTPYYTNINAKSRKEYYFNGSLDCLIVDFTDSKRMNADAKKMAGSLDAISYHLDASNGLIDNTVAFTAVIGACALLVFLNCIGFIRSWEDSYSEEFAVRKRVGGTDFSNNVILIIRFITLLAVSAILAAVLSSLAFVLLKKDLWLTDIRLTFGFKLHFYPVVLAAFSILIPGILVTEIQYMAKRKRYV